ncbi:hypothetical protein ACJX0J_018716, partial [Zea mays]
MENGQLLGQKNVAHRGSAFTKEEDADPIAGIDDAVKMYEEKEAFQFLKTQQPEGPCNPVGTQPNTENAAITRPEGRDTAKKRSAAVEHEMEVKNNEMRRGMALAIGEI